MTLKTEFVLSARDETQAAFSSANAALGKLSQGAADLVGAFHGMAAGALSLGAFTAAIKSSIDSLDKFDEAAERIGLTTEALSALTYAGKLSGLEFEDTTGAIAKLSAKMQDAASGSKEAAALFGDLGVKVKSSSGDMKPANQVIAEIADRFANFEEGAAKTALAMDLFGKSGAKMVPLLNGGAEGLEKMRKEAASLGGIIDSKLAKQAAQFNDNLDRLSTLSAAAGKSIAGGLLPWLNKAAESFLIAQKHSDGFFDSLMLKLPGFQSVNIADELTAARAQLEMLEASRERYIKSGNSLEDTKVDKMIASARRKLEYYKELQRNEALAMAGEVYGNEGRGKTIEFPKEKIKRTPVAEPKIPIKPETAEATDAAKEYAKAMQALAGSSLDATAAQMGLSKTQKTMLDLMQSPTFADMPDTWKATAVEQFEFARAAELAAEAQAHFNKLLSETDTSKLEASRKDMQLLADALESGRISEELYLEAVNKRLGDTSDKSKEASGVAKELGLTFSSAFEDAVIGGKKARDVIQGLAADVTRILARKLVTEPLANAAIGALKSVNWSSFFQAKANANGGVYTSRSLSEYSGKIVSSPTLFAFARGAGLMGEAGPEAILPLKRGADGKLGVSAGGSPEITVNVYNEGAADGYQATAQTRQNGAGFDIDVFIVKAIQQDQRRNGPITQGFASTFGLNRSTA